MKFWWSKKIINNSDGFKDLCYNQTYHDQCESALDKNYFPDHVSCATRRPCCLHTVSGLIKTLCGASCSLARGGGGSWSKIGASWTRRKLSSSSTWSPGAWWWIKLSIVVRGNFHNIHVAFFMLKKPIRSPHNQGVRERAWVSNLLIGCPKRRSRK